MSQLAPRVVGLQATAARVVGLGCQLAFVAARAWWCVACILWLILAGLEPTLSLSSSPLCLTRCRSGAVGGRPYLAPAMCGCVHVCDVVQVVVQPSLLDGHM